MASFGLLVLAASYAPDMLIGIPMLVGWVAVVLGMAHCSAAWAGSTPPAPAAVAVAVGLAAFLLIPVEPTDGARARLSRLGGAASTTGIPTAALHHGSARPAPAGHAVRDRRSCACRRTRRRCGGRPASTTTTASPGSGRPVGFARPVPGPPYQVSDPDGPVRTDQVERRWVGSVSDGTVWSPGPVVSVAGVTAAVVDADGERAGVADGGGDYTVTSVEPVVDPRRLRGSAGTDQVDERWRTLPVGLPSRVARAGASR